jgi:Zn-dependent protease with chaperone function
MVSQGLLQSLTEEQLQAVLTHEHAHLHYRDTFWFFWLGWVNRLTAWLPNSTLLWQELLLLRELRADRWAAQHVDSLVLAETLLQVVRSPLAPHPNEFLWVAFEEAALGDRLEQRIDALLSPGSPSNCQLHHWLWLALGLIPLLTLPLHT